MLKNIVNIFKKKDLIILDDFFPNLLSRFRVIEFNHYLKNIKKSKVFSFNIEYQKFYSEYIKYYPDNKNKISIKNEDEIFNTSLYYSVFLNNTFNFLPIIESTNANFVFTLYPGGGFVLNDTESDLKLNRIFKSSHFKKVITTQKLTSDYLIDKGLCVPSQIEFIYGGVFKENDSIQKVPQKQYFGFDKNYLDICFVANKYHSLGKDKGFDIFIESAKILIKKFKNIHFHIVGGFGEEDIFIENIKSRFTFYGPQLHSFFKIFNKQMDIIISPNRPFILSPGSFDGFPTGCCVEAGMDGVAVICSDELKLNKYFREGIEIKIISATIDDIVNTVSFYYKKPEKLKDLSINGFIRFNQVFSPKLQLEKRLNLLKQFI